MRTVDEQRRRRWDRRALLVLVAVLAVQIVGIAFTPAVLTAVLLDASWMLLVLVGVATVPLPRGRPAPGVSTGLARYPRAAFAFPLVYLVPSVWLDLRAETLPWSPIIGTGVATAAVLVLGTVILAVRTHRARAARARLVPLAPKTR